jgi:hypothetical protein
VKKIHRSLLSPRRHVLWLLPAAIGLAAAAHAEPLAAPNGGLATVRITGSALEPGRVAVGAAQHVVFQNDAAVMARVELELPRGEGIVCRTGREEATRGRKFVVAGGDVLECEPPGSRTRYRVYRVGAAGGAPVASQGELDPAAR